MSNNNEDDIFSFFKPKKTESDQDLTPEQRLKKNIQKRILKAFKDSLIEFGIEKAEEYYPIWKEQMEDWKKKTRNWFRSRK
ncbi:MAG: hypothetical protein EU540_09015 [Promethearchaeota archaeon]|nr:MAG: hypothetical protein EU540_09015 [Candidatus Lokiarchaeota archaeon]